MAERAEVNGKWRLCRFVVTFAARCFLFVFFFTASLHQLRRYDCRVISGRIGTTLSFNVWAYRKHSNECIDGWGNSIFPKWGIPQPRVDHDIVEKKVPDSPAAEGEERSGGGGLLCGTHGERFHFFYTFVADFIICF